MSIQFVNKYRLYCNVENAYVEVWGTVSPAMCPNNHEDRTNISNTVITSSLSETSAVVRHESPGYYQAYTMKHVVPVGATGSVSTFVHSFPMDVYVWTLTITTTSNMFGDMFSLVYNPDTIFGGLVQNAVTGDTTVHITPDAFLLGVITKGLDVKIDNGVISQYLGRITGFDSTAFTVTFENPLSNDYLAGSLMKVSVYIVKDQHVITNDNHEYYYGRKGFATRKVSANAPIHIVYTNNNTMTKDFYVTVEFNYD